MSDWKNITISELEYIIEDFEKQINNLITKLAIAKVLLERKKEAVKKSD